jgi:acetyl-CoA carboxylase biotin carboxyl carrier protein
VELKHIKELMAAMDRTGTKRLTLKRNDFELVLERDTADQGRSLDYLFPQVGEQHKQSQIQNRTDQALSRGSEMPAGRVASPITVEPPKVDANSLYVTSPMVGTFYTSPSPEDPSFVKVGDKIDKNTVVCIIEAMKVMNEIKAGVVGTIAEILVETGQPVEFGTKLFRITELG